MNGIHVLGACGLLLSSASCSKISGLQQLVQQSATPAQANSGPGSPAANSTGAPIASASRGPSSVSAAPGLRPHAAAGAKEAALKMYPALGIKDSAFNKVFRDLYAEKTRQDPQFLTKADWPLLLARRTAELLAPPTTTPPPPGATAQARPGAIASAPSAVAPAAPFAPSASIQAAPAASSGHSFHPVAGPNALEHGAYHQIGSAYWRWDGYKWVPYGSAVTTPTPSSVAGSTGDPTPRANPLDRGAYNQNRFTDAWNWYRYYYP